LFLKEKINEFGLDNDMNINVKYIDPTFTLRSRETNSLDKKIATSYFIFNLKKKTIFRRIAQNVVHCAMAGFTGFACGIANKSTVLIPVEEVLSNRYSRCILPNDANWQRLLSSNLQPCFINDQNVYLKPVQSTNDLLKGLTFK